MRTSSFANNPRLEHLEGKPFVEINPADAAARDISDGDRVIVANARGWCILQAVVTTNIRPGALASPKGRWLKNDPNMTANGSGRNINWTTPDTLADFAGQSTFHSNQVWIQKWKPEFDSTPN